MEQIRQVEPPQLFVGADGPRAGRPDDPQKCERAREVATDVNWECEVQTLFREENLGCKQAVSSAITWFFEHVEAGVILEDDCVPHPSFFHYCEDLLGRYRHDERIMAISGDNFQPPNREHNASYYYSAYPHVWGWATWRRAWANYDPGITAWSDLKDTSWLEGWLGSEAAARYWSGIFDKVARDEIDSWAYPWTFSCWMQHGLTILPSVNLVSNVGFGEHATHTTHGNPAMETSSLYFPLDHPTSIVRNYEADHYTSRYHFGVGDHATRRSEIIRRWIPSGIKHLIHPLMRNFRHD